MLGFDFILTDTTHRPRIISTNWVLMSFASRMESTASQADTYVAHGPSHITSQPPYTPYGKRLIVDDFGFPASIATMVADLRDLSRVIPPPAPSLSILSLVLDVMKLGYRVAEVKR